MAQSIAARVGHAHHVGSLIRPGELVDLFMQPLSGTPLTGTQQSRLAQLVARHMRQNVRLLAQVGLPRTSGEVQWLWYLGILGVLFDPSGLSYAPTIARLLPWHNLRGLPVPAETHGMVIPGVRRLEPTGNTVTQIETPVLDLSEQVGGPQVTMVSLPSASHLAMGLREGVTTHTLDQIFEIATPVLANQAAALVRAGFTIVKVDDPVSLQLGDPVIQADLAKDGIDVRHMLIMAAHSNNQVLQAVRDAGAVSALHMCNGNAAGQQIGDAGIHAVANVVLPSIKTDMLFFEALPYLDTDWRALTKIKHETMVVLGVVSSKYPALESIASLRHSIEKAARHYPLELLGISPQCGFASHVLGNFITPHVQQAKLELVVTAAKDMWGDQAIVH